ncbi:MAG: hypothetical protein PWQ35_561 [Patescibacteria group bacterium]|nr:hypothetical protein [Patescibacteria group bacterium]
MSESVSEDNLETKIEKNDPKLGLLTDLKVEFGQYLKRNEENNLAILKELRFIKRHYFFRSIFNIARTILIIFAVILGIASWNDIVGFFSNNLQDIISRL